MPITDNGGNKITAKNKAKLILQDHIERFVTTNYCDDLKPGQLKQVQDQVEKMLIRIEKILVIK